MMIMIMIIIIVVCCCLSSSLLLLLLLSLFLTPLPQRVLDQLEYQDFAKSNGEWSSGEAVQKPLPNKVLAHVVSVRGE